MNSSQRLPGMSVRAISHAMTTPMGSAIACTTNSSTTVLMMDTRMFGSAIALRQPSKEKAKSAPGMPSWNENTTSRITG